MFCCCNGKMMMKAKRRGRIRPGVMADPGPMSAINTSNTGSTSGLFSKQQDSAHGGRSSPSWRTRILSDERSVSVLRYIYVHLLMKRKTMKSTKVSSEEPFEKINRLSGFWITPCDVLWLAGRKRHHRRPSAFSSQFPCRITIVW